MGSVHFNRLNEKSAVVGHVYVSCEAERFYIERSECKVNATVTVHLDGVHYVITVECRTKF